jgi:hypothetical protein
VIGNVPGNQGINTEDQIRSQNPDLPRPSDLEEDEEE